MAGGLVGEIGTGSFVEESFASSYFSGGSSSAYFTGELIGGLVGVIVDAAREIAVKYSYSEAIMEDISAAKVGLLAGSLGVQENL